MKSMTLLKKHKNEKLENSFAQNDYKRGVWDALRAEKKISVMGS